MTDPGDVPFPGWLTAFRADGFGKAHAARDGDRKGRCGVPVRPARTGVLETPFRAGASRCAGCERLLRQDADRAESTRNAGQPEFTE